ncbi:hypothetical protein GCM10027442_41690 [Emticicia fontis]
MLGIAFPLIIREHNSFNYGVKAGLTLSDTSYNRSFYDKKILKPGACQIGITGKNGLNKELFLQLN